MQGEIPGTAIAVPHGFRSFMGVPWSWWRKLPHWHIAVYEPGAGIRCSICWQPYRMVRRAG